MPSLGRSTTLILTIVTVAGAAYALERAVAPARADEPQPASVRPQNATTAACSVAVDPTPSPPPSRAPPRDLHREFQGHVGRASPTFSVRFLVEDPRFLRAVEVHAIPAASEADLAKWRLEVRDGFARPVALALGGPRLDAATSVAAAGGDWSALVANDGLPLETDVRLVVDVLYGEPRAAPAAWPFVGWTGDGATKYALGMPGDPAPDAIELRFPPTLVSRAVTVTLRDELGNAVSTITYGTTQSESRALVQVPPEAARGMLIVDPNGDALPFAFDVKLLARQGFSHEAPLPR